MRNNDLWEQIVAWLSEETGLPAIEILERIKTLHPDRFTDKHARTVRRAVKRWRAEQAHRIIAEHAVTIGGVGRYGRRRISPAMAQSSLPPLNGRRFGRVSEVLRPLKLKHRTLAKVIAGGTGRAYLRQTLQCGCTL